MSRGKEMPLDLDSMASIKLANVVEVESVFVLPTSIIGEKVNLFDKIQFFLMYSIQFVHGIGKR